MAVAFDAVGNATGTGRPLSWTHTATGSNRCVIVGVAAGNGGAGSYVNYTRSVTYGGVAMTSAGAVNANNGTTGFAELFYLLNPATGAQTVTATTSADIGTQLANSVSYTGVGSVGSAVTSFTVTTPSLVVPSATNRRAVAVFGAGSAISGATQTQRVLNNHDNGSAAGNLLIQDAAGAASVTFSATNNGDSWACVGIDLREPAGGGTPTNTGAFFAMMF